MPPVSQAQEKLAIASIIRAGDVANYFWEKSFEEGIPCTHMKLQKLVYIAYGWYWALQNQALFAEKIYAWKYGPVIADLYDIFKQYGKNPISSPAPSYSLSLETRYPDIGHFLDVIWRSYGRLEGFQLSALTHQDGTPWVQCYKPDQDNILIPDSVIKEHYLEKLSQLKSK